MTEYIFTKYEAMLDNIKGLEIRADYVRRQIESLCKRYLKDEISDESAEFESFDYNKDSKIIFIYYHVGYGEEMEHTRIKVSGTELIKRCQLPLS